VEDKKGRILNRGVVKAKDLARAHEKVPRGHFKGKKQILYETEKILVTVIPIFGTGGSYVNTFVILPKRFF